MALQKHILKISGQQYVLPVPPSEWKVNDSNNVTTANVLNFGEMNTGSKPNLRTTSISSFFSVENIGFVNGSEFKKPNEYIEAFKKAKDEGIQIEYEITGTSIYMICIVTGFSIGEKDYTGRIFYTLDLKEDKSVDLVNKDGKVDTTGYVPEDNKGNYFWSVKEGDTALTIAKKAYGDSTKYKELLSKNKLSNPSQLKVGMVVKL